MEDRYNRKRSRSRPGRSSSLRMDADKLSGAPTQNNTLNPSQYNFCLHYLQNGLNATAAYRAAYPGVTGPTACTNAYRLLRNAEIRTFLTQELGDRWKALHMSGDEVVARVAMDARADTGCHRFRRLTIRLLSDPSQATFDFGHRRNLTLIETPDVHTPRRLSGEVGFDHFGPASLLFVAEEHRHRRLRPADVAVPNEKCVVLGAKMPD